MDNADKLWGIVHQLHRNHHVDAGEPIPCDRCDGTSRGHLCTDCLIADLVELTGDRHAANRYRSTLELQQELLRRMVSAVANPAQSDP